MSRTRSGASGADKEIAIIFSEKERIYVASQWQLMWWKFKKHRVAMVGIAVLIVLYTLGLFCEFFAPYDPHRYDKAYVFAPPQRLRFIDEEGFHLRPFVYGLKQRRDPETLRAIYDVDKTRRCLVHFLVHGDPYELWGRWEADVHLFGLSNADGSIFLFGADRLGRDMLSRVIHGSRISLSIGLVGIFSSFVLGIIVGGFSGYYGGVFDMVTQRIIEFLRSLPTIPLWMTLSAAVPLSWSPISVYFGITVILSFVGWTGLARVVRGRFLALREEDIVVAAKLAGASELRIITRHLVPSFMSHLIASITLSIPGMILGETSLSFLGLGLRPPVISWGVLLKEGQEVRIVALAPWLLIPGAFVIVTVLAFNFVGDGLRDAADPYAR